MRDSFPTRDDLIEKSLDKLRLIDVVDKDEETLLQEVIDLKSVNLPPIQEIKTSDIPDIKTPEEEAKYQAIVDERVAKAKGLEEVEKTTIEENVAPALEEVPIKLEEVPIEKVAKVKKVK